MTRPRLALAILAASFAAPLGFPSGAGAFAQTAPAAQPAVTEDLRIDLASAFPDVQAARDHDFRARKIELAPGQRTELVNHAGRPSITYVISGVAAEHRTGAGEPLTHGPGAATMDRGGISHYWENRSGEPLVLLIVGVSPVTGG